MGPTGPQGFVTLPAVLTVNDPNGDALQIANTGVGEPVSGVFSITSTAQTALTTPVPFGQGYAALAGVNTGGNGATVGYYGAGVSGIVTSKTNKAAGVVGETRATDGTGVFGYDTSDGGGKGVWGYSDNGNGVLGSAFSSSFAAVAGVNTTGAGVFGQSESGAGVVGQSDSADGVFGLSTTSAGSGVEGASTDGNGVYGHSTNGNGAFFQAGTASCSLPHNATGWSCTSDRNLKEDFRPIDGEDVLRRVAALPLFNYRMKGDTDPALRWIGPTAQDFMAAFHLGHDDTHINAANEMGVALAAIQGLHQEIEDRDAKIAALEERLARIESRIDKNAIGVRQAASAKAPGGTR